VTPLSALALLVDLVELLTHWGFLRWAEYGLGIAVQALAVIAWWGAKRAPRAVVWSCPYCGCVQGDQLSVRVHVEREHP
jgi:hypothetical protein